MTLLSKKEQRQEGNDVGGHLAGGDVNESITNNVNFAFYAPQMSRTPASPMQLLIAKLQAETQADPELTRTIRLLQNYKMRRGPAIGLNTKLTLAQWPDDEIEWAMQWKETFAKRLETHQFSAAATQILAYLLGRVLSNFRTHVRPLIADGATRDEIESAAITHVVEPALKSLEENPLGIFHDEIWGAIYFLTGNCHIRWDTE